MENEQLEVVFLDDDKLTVLDRQFVKYGESVKYKGEKPEKAPTLEGTYTFEGWSDEEKLECVTQRLILVAMYKLEINAETKDAMFEASLENAKNANLNETMEAGKKVNEQQIALEKDPRSITEIVNDILKNGQTEVGMDIDKSKDNVEK